ncbi:MAG: glycosyl hydrolase 108 family protein, partial [Nostoc sp.]
DSGGLTKFGITHTEYYNYRAKKGLPQRSVRLISLTEAQDIYKHYYWENSGCDYPPRRIAIACLDWQVNSGRGFATLQQTLGLKPDAIVGHQT